MKPGDCFIDDYYEPETVVIKATDLGDSDGYVCRVVYTSSSECIEIGAKISRYSNDKELIPVAMITIDNKVILINL